MTKNKYLDMVKMSDQEYFSLPYLSNRDFKLLKIGDYAPSIFSFNYIKEQ